MWRRWRDGRYQCRRLYCVRCVGSVHVCAGASYACHQPAVQVRSDCLTSLAFSAHVMETFRSVMCRRALCTVPPESCQYFMALFISTQAMRPRRDVDIKWRSKQHHPAHARVEPRSSLLGKRTSIGQAMRLLTKGKLWVLADTSLERHSLATKPHVSISASRSSAIKSMLCFSMSKHALSLVEFQRV